MEYIKKEELIEGEIYVFDNKFINKIQSGHLNIKCWISIPGKYFYKKDSNNNTSNIVNATSEEKHWLNTCIKLDKFITFEEAMKTFIPEYVEAIQQSDGYTIGKIYKTLSDSTKEWYRNIDDKNRENGWSYLNFKPSTKKAYDAQFVVKEPLPQFKVIETVETITKVENNEGNQFFIGDVVKSSNGTVQTIESFDYNTKKTNIIAFTNKQSILGNGIGIDKIEHYIEPKVEVEETLLEKAKRLYPVGTKVRTATDNHFMITIKDQSKFRIESNNDITTTENYMIYLYCSYENKWAEIIN